MITIYGIKNCDTMKKARHWLDHHGVQYNFHDYKKENIDTNVLKQAIAAHGWEAVINRRGTSWRQLPEDIKNNMDEAGALAAARENPSLIKRPLLVYHGQIYLGFSGAQYEEIFG